MWKLWHRLFGWDYVLIKFWSYEFRRRIKATPTGREYVTPWGEHSEMVFLNDPSPWDVIHLTRQTNETR